MTDEDLWASLRRFTDARIGLGRSGAALPTRALLDFVTAHALARDAVLAPLDWSPIEQGLAAEGLEWVHVSSAAGDRETYLRRPDLGRRLGDDARAVLTAAAQRQAGRPDVVIMAGDGLSSMGVSSNLLPFLRALLPRLARYPWRLGPVVLADQARVALGDAVGECLGAAMVLVLIGERPGLTSPDSLGAYLTFDPRVGRTDAERNCLSNIRSRGLPWETAAFRAAWLMAEAFRLRLTGVPLKDRSTMALEGRSEPPSLGS